jgi:hypothetical protein
MHPATNTATATASVNICEFKMAPCKIAAAPRQPPGSPRKIIAVL